MSDAVADGVPRFDRATVLGLDHERLREAMRATLALISSGRAVAPVRTHLDLGGGAGCYLITGALPELDVLSVKVINLVPDNPARGLARLQGMVAVFSHRDGRPLALLDAQAATEARTAALSAVAVRLMARPDAGVLTVFGTGPQARAHVRSLRAALPLREVRVVSRTRGAGEALAAELGGSACEAGRALAGAHVVVCATNSRIPVFPAGAVEPGTHLCLVGSGSAEAAEVEPRLLARAEALRVDHRPTCLTESGEIVGALREGLIDEGAVRELGEVVLGSVPGRLTPQGITVYKSVGNGAEDAGLAAALLGRL